ncbi:MAG: hypothetical protein HQK84_06245 [Nitrospinae bacterium]|nr:hypothetical protein [Nitrospinota bacterium]
MLNTIKNNKEKIFTAVLVIYITLLGIGTIAELFDIESILDWWIWRPPGKY